MHAPCEAAPRLGMLAELLCCSEWAILSPFSAISNPGTRVLAYTMSDSKALARYLGRHIGMARSGVETNELLCALLYASLCLNKALLVH